MNEVPIIDHETFILEKERLKKSGEWSGKAENQMSQILDLLGKTFNFTLITSDGGEIDFIQIFAAAFGMAEEIIKTGSFIFPTVNGYCEIVDVLFPDPTLKQNISMVEEFKDELF